VPSINTIGTLASNEDMNDNGLQLCRARKAVLVPGSGELKGKSRSKLSFQTLPIAIKAETKYGRTPLSRALLPQTSMYSINSSVFQVTSSNEAVRQWWLCSQASHALLASSL
jgi:hypothetical protein